MKTQNEVQSMANKYEIEKELFVKNLSKDDLESYIESLLRKYYDTLLSKKNDEVVKILKDIYQVIDLRGGDLGEYPYLTHYIHQRMIILSNGIFKKLLDDDCDLYYPISKITLDFKPEEANDLSSFFDDESITKLLIECHEEDFDRFMTFVKDLPQIKVYSKDKTIENAVSRKFIAKVTKFLNEVKEGAYDGYLEIPEYYIIDDEDFDEDLYVRNRHKERLEGD